MYKIKVVVWGNNPKGLPNRSFHSSFKLTLETKFIIIKKIKIKILTHVSKFLDQCQKLDLKGISICFSIQRTIIRINKKNNTEKK